MENDPQTPPTAAPSPAQTPAPVTPAKPPLTENEKMTHIIYGLQIASFVFGITSIVGVIINYMKSKAATLNPTSAGRSTLSG